MDSQHVRDELGWLGRALGAVRDLDVQLERLEEWEEDLPESDRDALQELNGLLRHDRAVDRDELLSCLNSSRYERLVSGFSEMLREGPPRSSAAGGAPAVAIVPDLVQSRHHAAVKSAKHARENGAADDYHQLRIRCKRLRYALEFVSEIYEGQTAKMVGHVVRLQDALGFMQDARVADARLRELAIDDARSLSPTTIFAMGAVAGRYRFEAARMRRSLPGLLKHLKGSPWQKTKAVMERKTVDLGAPFSWPSQPLADHVVEHGATNEDGTAPPLR